jgi:hypothetical protein
VITDSERKERYKKLHLTQEQERELLEYDKSCERGEKTDFDLPPDKLKVAQKFSHTGTRKAPPGYKWSKRERKPNATKGGIIAELANFLESNSQFSIESLEVLNPEKLISFSIGGNTYELDLKQKRKPKEKGGD